MKKMNGTLSWGLGVLVAAGLAASAFGQAAAPAADGRFMMDAVAGGMAEIELSRLAADKASRPEVKALAQMLVDDHTMVNAELGELAQRKHVALPTDLNPEARTQRDQLSKLAGPAFDDAYLKAVAKGHERSIGLFTKQSNAGADPDAKAWATKILPKLQGHLTRIQDVSGSR